MWKESLSQADRIVEPDIASADGTVVCEHPTNDLFPMTTHSDTAALPATEPRSLTTEETAASASSCPNTDGVLTAESSSGGLGHTDVEPSSESEKQEPELDRCSSDGVAELPVAAGGSQNSVPLSAESVIAQPDECQDGQNLMSTLPGPSDPAAVVTSSSQATVSSLSADSEAHSSLSVDTTVASAASNTADTDDNHLLPARQVHESLSSENIQPSASESQMVCGLVH